MIDDIVIAGDVNLVQYIQVTHKFHKMSNYTVFFYDKKKHSKILELSLKTKAFWIHQIVFR